MELINYLEFILFILCILFSLYYIFIVFRKNNINYSDIIDKLNIKKDEDIKFIEQMNNEIELINKEIRRCNKILNKHYFE